MTQEHKNRIYDLFVETKYNDLVEVIEAIFEEQSFENPIFETLGIYDSLTKRKADNAKPNLMFLSCTHPERRMLLEIGEIALYILFKRTTPFIKKYKLENRI